MGDDRNQTNLSTKEDGRAAGSGKRTKSVRRLGVAPLSRRCRARAGARTGRPTKNIPVTKAPGREGPQEPIEPHRGTNTFANVPGTLGSDAAAARC